MAGLTEQSGNNGRNGYRKFYILSLAGIIALSVYPIYMGVYTFEMYCRYGAIMAEDYRKYIIPYTPLSIALIASAALLPVFYRYNKRWSLWLGSVVGVGIFLVTELFLEQIRVVEINVVDGAATLPLEVWQYSLCLATPQVLESIGEPLFAGDNPAFKFHFYLIAIVIILCVLRILHGYTEMYQEQRYDKKRIWIVLTICVAVFVSLCIMACFTAFYRNGTLFLSPLSSFLTGLFFVVFGITFGINFYSAFCKKRRRAAVAYPAVIAVLTTAAMYAGELILMGGELFRFGAGVFFEPFLMLPFSLCDIGIIVISGAVTALIAYFLPGYDSMDSRSL